MKIKRLRRGKKGSTTLPRKAYVIISEVGACKAAYFQLFRGYKVSVDNRVLYKEIVSEEESFRRATTSL